jgi:hypothetical protein
MKRLERPQRPTSDREPVVRADIGRKTQNLDGPMEAIGEIPTRTKAPVKVRKDTFDRTAPPELLKHLSNARVNGGEQICGAHANVHGTVGHREYSNPRLRVGKVLAITGESNYDRVALAGDELGRSRDGPEVWKPLWAHDGVPHCVLQGTLRKLVAPEAHHGVYF